MKFNDDDCRLNFFSVGKSTPKRSDEDCRLNFFSVAKVRPGTARLPDLDRVTDNLETRLTDNLEIRIV